jgi:hypothetical protein
MSQQQIAVVLGLRRAFEQFKHHTVVKPDGSVFVTYDSGSVTGYPPGSPGALKRGAPSVGPPTAAEFLAWNDRLNKAGGSQ